MTEETLTAIRAHAKECYPSESCGVVLIWKGKERYRPCRNLAAGTSHFRIHHEDYAAAEDEGDILTIVHSHPDAAPIPSQADLISCEETGLPWLIIGWPVGDLHEFQPSGYKAPLIGRVFTFGVLDCWKLIIDWYQQELQIELPDFERQQGWEFTDLNPYVDNFAKVGFRKVEDLKKHDVFLGVLGYPRLNPEGKPNHGGVYLGDDVILHHPMNRLSGRETFSGYWQRITTHTLRHEKLL
jgi:proteasome lid subunit RPN8/RPN11